MLFVYAVSIFASVFLCNAQSNTTEPCAQVRSLLASGKIIPASVAEACALSAPLVEDQALDIIDGLSSAIQWQSTDAWLKNPPSNYPFPALDITNELSALSNQIKSGIVKSEILFERTVTSILNRAHDGHLRYPLDGMSVFTYRTGFGSLAVVSLDGQQTPGIYINNEIIAFAKGLAKAPSAVTAINGVKAADWLQQQGMNLTRFQDLDAIFNDFMHGPPLVSGASTIGSFDTSPGFYRGNSTTLGFDNGTEITRPNYATTSSSFFNVVDGKSFSLNFCNATEKARQAGSASAAIKAKVKVAVAGTNSTQASNSQSLVGTTGDGSMSGFFLNTPGFEDTAVLVIQSFESTLATFQTTLSKFLTRCRTENKKHLVIDVTADGGGVILLVYEVFKQLFPNIDPYLAGNLRANDALNIWGEAITDNAKKVSDAKGGLAAYVSAGGYSDYDARAYLNENGTLFQSWSEFYGPVKAPQGDNFTNLFRWNIRNSDFVSRGANRSISNTKQQGPQTFNAKNIVIMGDGRCSSSCTLLSHLLKWQGKVKSVAVGGRPQTGPMQQQGGVKGAEVHSVRETVGVVKEFLTSAQLSALNTTNFVTLNSLNDLLSLRATGDLSYNAKNNIAEGDATLTPLQFVYEAADCRLFNRPKWLVDASLKWLETAKQAFGLNGTTAWSGCVANSTNQPSSLSGNPALFNNGKANNVTAASIKSTQAQGTGNIIIGNNSTNNNGTFRAPATSKNEGGRSTSPFGFAIIVTVAAMVLGI